MEDTIMKKNINKRVFTSAVIILANAALIQESLGFNPDEDVSYSATMTSHVAPISTSPLLKDNIEEDAQKMDFLAKKISENKLLLAEEDKIDTSIESAILKMFGKALNSAITKKGGSEVAEKLINSAVKKVVGKKVTELTAEDLSKETIDVIIKNLAKTQGTVSSEIIDEIVKTTVKSFRKDTSKSAGKSLRFVSQTGKKKGRESFKDVFSNTASSTGKVLVKETGETIKHDARTAGSTTRTAITNVAVLGVGAGGGALYIKSKNNDGGGNNKKEDINSESVEELEKMRTKLKEQEELYKALIKKLENPELTQPVKDPTPITPAPVTEIKG